MHARIYLKLEDKKSFLIPWKQQFDFIIIKRGLPILRTGKEKTFLQSSLISFKKRVRTRIELLTHELVEWRLLVRNDTGRASKSKELRQAWDENEEHWKQESIF
jgi:hypothetical protein